MSGESQLRNAKEMGRLIGHGEVLSLIQKHALERIAHGRTEVARGAHQTAKIADEVGKYLLTLVASLPSELREIPEKDRT